MYKLCIRKAYTYAFLFSPTNFFLYFSVPLLFAKESTIHGWRRFLQPGSMGIFVGVHLNLKAPYNLV
jgi:hypothetical protein